MKITKLNEWASIDKRFSVVGTFHCLVYVTNLNLSNFLGFLFLFIRSISSVCITNLSNPSFKFHESFTYLGFSSIYTLVFWRYTNVNLHVTVHVIVHYCTKCTHATRYECNECRVVILTHKTTTSIKLFSSVQMCFTKTIIDGSTS